MASELERYFEALRAHFVPGLDLDTWWPAAGRFEIIVGAILVQNTAWTNVAKAIASLRSAGRLSVAGIRDLGEAELGALIRSSGCWRQKAKRLAGFVAWLDRTYGGDLDRLFAQPTPRLRAELLELHGIGEETADAILLFAGRQPSFVLDAYTRRILERHQLPAQRAWIEASLRPVPRLLLVLGALCALAFFVENAWQSWGAVHLESDLGASPALGALAPALFAGAAALSRLSGHALAGRVSELTLLRGGAVLGAAGTLLGALAPAAGLALVGVVAAGAGISICAPVLFSIAGRGADEAVRGAAVSVVTTIAYLGFLVGPAAVGLLASATTLETSLAAVAAVSLALAALAGLATRR